jgi:hypothetical protein
VQRDAEHDERDADEVDRTRQLMQDDDPDRSRRRRQQRDEQRVGRARQPGHRELVEHVRDHGRRQPDADAGGERNRIRDRRGRVTEPDREDQDERDQHRRTQTVHAAQPSAAREPVGEDDVRREERGVRERERYSDRLPDEPHLREQVDADRRCSNRGEVAGNPGAEQGEPDGSEELDRRHHRQRQAVDRHVEACVHRREHRPQPADEQPAAAIESGEPPPGPPPDREHRRRGSDPQPRDSERLDPREQEHRERRPEVVEDGAADEVRVRGNRVGAAPDLHESDCCRGGPRWTQRNDGVMLATRDERRSFTNLGCEYCAT